MIVVVPDVPQYDRAFGRRPESLAGAQWLRTRGSPPRIEMAAMIATEARSTPGVATTN